MLRTFVASITIALIVASGAQAASFTLSPSLVKLGRVDVGETVLRTITLTDTSNERLTVDSFEAFGVNGNFVIRPRYCTLGTILNPDESCSFALETTPVQPGRISGTFCYTMVSSTTFERICARVRGHAHP